MTSIAILPVPGEQGEVTYQAVAGPRRSEGRTAGEALDALAAQLPRDASSTLVVVQFSRPDQFFTEAQQRRLAELMQRWRSARDRGEALPPSEQEELDALVEAELVASGQRAAALADAAGR
jgi:lysophospholipase L1-like esterase